MTTFGTIVRQARASKQLTLRELARRLAISAPYLSDIELGRGTPAEPVLREIARLLDLDAGTLHDRTGRLDERTRRYLKKRPAAAHLLRRLAHLNADDQQLGQLAALLDEPRRNR